MRRGHRIHLPCDSVESFVLRCNIKSLSVAVPELGNNSLEVFPIAMLPFVSIFIISALVVRTGSVVLKLSLVDASSTSGLGLTDRTACGISGPTSCHNTSAQSDLCCFEAPGVSLNPLFPPPISNIFKCLPSRVSLLKHNSGEVHLHSLVRGMSITNQP